MQGRQWHIRHWVHKDIERSSVEVENFRLAYSFDLPFHLNVGKHYRANFRHANSLFTIYCHNVEILKDGEEGVADAMKKWSENESSFDTRVVVLTNDFRISDEQLSGFKESRTEDNLWLTHMSDSQLVAKMPDRIFDLLHRFVLACYMVNQDKRGRGPHFPILTPLDFGALLKGQHWIVTPVEIDLSDDELEEIALYQADLGGRFGPSMATQRMFRRGELRREQLIAIHSKMDLLDSSIYFEFEHQAKVYMEGGRSDLALLMACIALEGAHAALIHAVLDSKLQPEMSESAAFGQINNMVREQGMYSLVGITPYLFLPENDRPTADQVKACRDAFTLRNDIVHAKANWTGPKLRQHTESEYGKGYSAVLQMFRRFANAVERRHEESS